MCFRQKTAFSWMEFDGISDRFHFNLQAFNLYLIFPLVIGPNRPSDHLRPIVDRKMPCGPTARCAADASTQMVAFFMTNSGRKPFGSPALFLTCCKPPYFLLVVLCPLTSLGGKTRVSVQQTQMMSSHLRPKFASLPFANQIFGSKIWHYRIFALLFASPCLC